jgi:hypothetical protein
VRFLVLCVGGTLRTAIRNGGAEKEEKWCSKKTHDIQEGAVSKE